MPTIHSTHIKANKAISALLNQLADAEVLAERIANDYGEDLVLQTHFLGNADPFTIRVQVKYAALKKIVRNNSHINLMLITCVDGLLTSTP